MADLLLVLLLAAELLETVRQPIPIGVALDEDGRARYEQLQDTQPELTLLLVGGFQRGADPKNYFVRNYSPHPGMHSELLTCFVV